MAFQFDTAGAVTIPRHAGYSFYKPEPTDRLAWSDLSPFVQGYVEAMFAGLAAQPCCAEIASHRWPEFGQGGRRPCERCGLPVIPNMGRNTPALAFSDLAPETLARIMEDCAAFLADPEWVTSGPKDEALSLQYGREFWTYRHAPHAADCIFKRIAQRFPPLTPYLGDDGKVYLRE